MKKRLFALSMALIMMLSLFAGCSKSEDPEQGGKNPSSSQKDPVAADAALGKYAYQAEYIPLDFGESKPDYIQNLLVSGDKLYITCELKAGEEPWIDEFTGEPYLNDATGEPIMNAVYEIGVFCMDLTNRTMKRIEGYQPYEIPEDKLGNSYLSGMQVSKDGALWLNEQISTYYFDLPADFDPETDDRYAYYMQDPNRNLLHQIDETGALVQTIELEVPAETYLNNISILDDGRILAIDWQGFLLFDASGKMVSQTTVETGIDRVLPMADGSFMVSTWTEDGTWLKPLDLNTLALGEGEKLKPNTYNLYGGFDGFDYVYDYDGTFFGMKLGGEEGEKLFSWIDCDVDSSNLYGMTQFGPDGTVYTLESIYNQQGEQEIGSNSYNLIVMNQVDPASIPVKEILTLGCFYLDWDLRKAVVEFNRSHDDLRIVVTDYAQYATSEDYQAGLDKLNTEIMSGHVPDILLVNQEMPFDQYASKDVFLDLWPLIDSDPELSREDLMTHFFDCLSSEDGKLYQIVDSFAISTATGKESVVGSGMSWTMDDLMNALSQQPEGTTIFSNWDTREAILNSCIARNAESFIDWETQMCSFDSQEFVGLLEFANQFPEQSYDYNDGIAVDTPAYEESESTASLLRSGKQMLYPTYIGDFSSVQWANAVFDEPASFIGYPTTSNNGSAFQIYSGLAIGATCSNVDAAWSFIRTYLTEEHQISDYMYEFPTNKHAFDAYVKQAMETRYYTDYETGEQVEQPSTSIWYGMEDEKLLYAVTQEEVDLFMEIYENCTNFTFYNQEIFDLIYEEAQAYFDGQKTVEETARLIQDRISLYVMENA